MRDRFVSLLVFFGGMWLLSSPVAAQVYFPSANGHRDPQSTAAAKAAPKPTYDPHDLSGVWLGKGGALLPDKTLPPFTPMGQKMFSANKPSQYARTGEPAPGKYIPAFGNDPIAKCDPLGYPREAGGIFEFVQTPGKIVQIFEDGRRIREIWTDGRKLPDDLDPRWYGWAVGHWEGDALVVDSSGYDPRTWLDQGGHPHSDEMHIVEHYRHPDAATLELSMTLEDPKVYTGSWSGQKTFTMELPKGLTVLDEHYCVPSEEQSFDERVRDPAAGKVSGKP